MLREISPEVVNKTYTENVKMVCFWDIIWDRHTNGQVNRDMSLPYYAPENAYYAPNYAHYAFIMTSSDFYTLFDNK